MVGGDDFGTEPAGGFGSFSEQSKSLVFGDQGTVPKSGRIPPHHAEAERSVLGAILLDNEAIHKVLEIGLEARDFYREAHQKIFEVALSLSERGEPVDLV